MKKSLEEDIKRIHEITYGKQFLTEEDGFLDKILKTVGLRPQDEPGKADLVSDDVNEFYNNIQQSIQSGGLNQQKLGSMTFQKGVESMQIGLTLLGYELPKFGVDGLFGPETATAVAKFKQDNQILNEASSELRSTLRDLGYSESNNEISSAGEISDELSNVVSNILKTFKQSNPNVGVVVTSGNDKFHQKLNYNSSHKSGDAVDITLKPANSQTIQAFENVLSQFKNGGFSYINEYNNPSSASTGGHFHLQYGGNSNTTNPQSSTATPEMLTKLLELLKQKGVTSEDLKKHIDMVNMEDLADKNFYAKLLENLGAPISEENLKFLYAWRQAEGKGGLNNPFNTTWELPGSESINSHGVKSYRTLQDGMVATIKTLKNGKYNCIVDGLKNDIGADRIARCESLKTWGTGDLVGKVVASYNGGSSPKISSLA